MSAQSQQAYVEALDNAQTSIVTSIEAVGGDVIDRYTKAYNGMLVRLPANQLDDVRQLPGVGAIHRAPVHVPSLEYSVPQIRADQVISNTLYDGDGVTITQEHFEASLQEMLEAR